MVLLLHQETKEYGMRVIVTLINLCVTLLSVSLRLIAKCCVAGGAPSKNLDHKILYRNRIAIFVEYWSRLI